MDDKEKLLTEWQAIIDGHFEERKRFWGALTLQQLQEFIAAGIDVNAKGEQGSTPLHHTALHSASIEVIRELIKAGSDVNAEDDGHSTPLHWAAMFADNVEIIKELINAGANIHAKDYLGETPYDRFLEDNNTLKDDEEAKDREEAIELLKPKP